MPKKANKGKKDSSRRVNVDIAPGNAVRLMTYIRRFNARPDRSKPLLTATDVLNAALDALFSEKG
jgi:hypothetical protein